MSLTSAMGASVAGLTGNSTRLAVISDNIANASTYGYKKVTAEFDSLVLGQGGGGYSAGGVLASTSRAVDKNMGLVPGSGPGDIAIAGAGMLPVTLSTAVDAPVSERPMLLTRTGSFKEDKSGYLKTDSGLALMGWPANPDGTFPSVSRDTSTALRPVRFTNAQGTGTPTTQIKLAINLPAEATDSTIADNSGKAIITPVEYYGNIGTREKLDFSFTPHLDKANDRSDKWTMKIIDYSTGAEGKEIGSLVIEFTETRGVASNIKTVTGDGYDKDTGILTVKIGEDDLEVVIGSPFNSTEFLKSDSGSLNTQKISVNGSPTGTKIGFEIDQDGFVIGIFSGGTTKRLFQIPLVSVANYNGLTARSSQTFNLSPEAGRFFLWNSGKGPVGLVQGGARENSTTDIAEELTNMIQTQRAYASNAKVITTVDEMLQETMNIKR